MPVLSNRLKGIIRDNVPFFRPGYFLVAGPKYLCFFSVQLKGNIIVHVEAVLPEPTDKTVIDFFSKLRKDGYYFGQEITVLLAEPAVYTILRPTDAVTLDQLREECRQLAVGTKHNQECRSIVLAGRQYYAIWGSDDQFLTNLLGQLDKANFLVQKVATLSALVLSMVPTTVGATTQPDLKVSIGRIKCFLGHDERKNIFYYEYADDSEPEFIPGFSTSSLIETTRPCDQKPQRKHKSLKGFFRTPQRGIVPLSLSQEYSLSLPKSAMPPYLRYLLVGTGSARLLALIAIFLLFVFLTIGAGYSVLASGSREAYNRYQDNLTDIAFLESKLHDLERRLDAAGSNSNFGCNLSGGLSLFCQRVPANLYLTGLKAERTADKSIKITGQGQARNESAIFQYRDYLNGLDSNVNFQIRSISKMSTVGMADSSWYKFIIDRK